MTVTKTTRCSQLAAIVGRPRRPHLFDETHEASAEPPGFVAMALQRVHRHLRSVLVGDGHDVDGVVGERRVCLEYGMETRQLVSVDVHLRPIVWSVWI